MPVSAPDSAHGCPSRRSVLAPGAGTAGWRTGSSASTCGSLAAKPGGAATSVRKTPTASAVNVDCEHHAALDRKPPKKPDYSYVSPLGPRKMQAGHRLTGVGTIDCPSSGRSVPPDHSVLGPGRERMFSNARPASSRAEEYPGTTVASSRSTRSWSAGSARASPISPSANAAKNRTSTELSDSAAINGSTAVGRAGLARPSQEGAAVRRRCPQRTMPNRRLTASAWTGGILPGSKYCVRRSGGTLFLRRRGACSYRKAVAMMQAAPIGRSSERGVTAWLEAIGPKRRISIAPSAIGASARQQGSPAFLPRTGRAVDARRLALLDDRLHSSPPPPAAPCPPREGSSRSAPQ